MGWTQDSFASKVDGHDVVVEARSGPISARFALKMDGEVQDMTKAIRGEHFLEGEVPGENGRPESRSAYGWFSRPLGLPARSTT